MRKPQPWRRASSSTQVIICVPRLAASATLRVPPPSNRQAFATEPASGGNGTDLAVAVLVDGVARLLARARLDRGVRVVAVLRAREAVRVAVEVGRVGARAVLVDAVVRDVRHARADLRLGVVAVGRAADAVAVGVALDLLAGDAVCRRRR